MVFELRKGIERFWRDQRKINMVYIHWARWDTISHAKSIGGLGFRDFTSFNQAMVAKQGWTLLQFSNSLVSRVMQARYYQNSDFLSANAGSNPSFIWRSILWGRQVLKKGIRWCIGNDKKISVFSDNWLSRLDIFKPISPPNLPVDSVVADLIGSENQWNAEKLNQYFRQEDVEIILKIPLPKEQSADEVMWHFDKKGEYSVKSGYQLALKIKFSNDTSSSDSSSKHWKVLWSLDLPEKIKISLWRAAKNLLLSAENIWKR